MAVSSDRVWAQRNATPEWKLCRYHSVLAELVPFLRTHGHIDEAIEVLNALSWGDETYECGDYAFELGRCYEAKGDLAEALRYFEIALRENPPVFGREEAVARIKTQLGV